MGWRTAFGFSKRPFIGDQTTARLAVEHPQGFNYAPIAAGGPQGVAFTRSPGPYNRPTMAAPNLHLSDPTVTGNPAGSLGVTPLVEDGETIYGSRQF